MTPDFTREQQLAFFASLSERYDYKIWGVHLDEYGPIGAAGLKNIVDESAEYWGYIGEKNLWGSGLGASLVHAVEGKAAELHIQLLFLYVDVRNERAIRLYRKLGYCQVGRSDHRLEMKKCLN